MKVTYNWLKDFVEIKIAPKVLADRLTMAGLEVTSLEEKFGDFVFEIEVTSNRPDCLSVVGLAREVAAVTGKKLSRSAVSRLVRSTGKWFDKLIIPRAIPSKVGGQANRLKINIEDKKDCPLYTAKLIRDVRVGPSPEWLKRRLELIGCRSVNNIVDITNYILFEWGEPLHGFDLDKLSGEAIIIRRAKENEKITTIDGEEKILNPDILVIADAERAVAVAGIMGGKDTEVSQNTENILLEAAVFNPLVIRRGRQRLGLQSESSYRFERGVDLETAQRASWRALDLIQKTCGGRPVLAKSAGLTRAKKKKVNLDVSLVHKILGVDIEPSRIKKILNSLEFKTQINSRRTFMVEAPLHRPDVNLAIDLIEEIARIYGFERISKTLPRVNPQISSRDTRDTVALIKNILVGLGLNEVITHSLVDEELLRGFAEHPDELIEIANPLSQEQQALRPALMPSLSQCVAYNLRQKQGYINIFEIAKAYTKTKNKVSEQYMLGIALCGMQSRWFGQEYKHVPDQVGFLHLKGILEILLRRLGISKKDYRFIPQRGGWEFGLEVKEVSIGRLQRLRREILDNLDIKNKDVFLAEINLENLLPYIQINKKFKPFPRYPGIARDISLVLKEDIPIEQVMEVVFMSSQGNLLQDVEVTDHYKGKQIPAGFKGLTISCLYCSDERTLTEAEVDPIHNGVVKGLKDKLQAEIR